MKTKQKLKTMFQKHNRHHVLLGVFCGMVLAMMSMQYFAPSAFAEDTKIGTETRESIKSWGNDGTSASEIFDKIIRDANQGEKIQNTALDKTNASEGRFTGGYRITNTIDVLKDKINPYLQWFLFASLSIATILIIIVGVQLVTSSQSSYDMKKAIAKLKNIGIGIVLITGVYALIKLFMVALVYILK